MQCGTLQVPFFQVFKQSELKQLLAGEVKYLHELHANPVDFCQTSYHLLFIPQLLV